MRPEKEDPQIWQPTWKCFCCHDSGLVYNGLAALVIDGYDSSHDKLPRCQNDGCTAGSHYDGPTLTASVDYRLTPDICAALDRIERDNWRSYVQKKRQKLKIDLSTIGKNLRGRSRTSTEEMEAIQKHQAVIAEMNGHFKAEDSVEQS